MTSARVIFALAGVGAVLSPGVPASATAQVTKVKIPRHASIVPVVYKDAKCEIELLYPEGWRVRKLGDPLANCKLALAPENWSEIVKRSELREPDVPLTVESSHRPTDDVFGEAGFRREPDGQWRLTVSPYGSPERIKDTEAFGLRAELHDRAYSRGGGYASVAELPVAAFSFPGGLNVVVRADSGGSTYDAFELVVRSLRRYSANAK